MTTLLVTRPEPQAERTTRQLEAAGFEVIRAPMLQIVFHAGAAKELAIAIEAQPPQAVLITSQHAAQILRQVESAAGCPILAVGPASAEAAREAGATDIATAESDAASLLALTKARCTPNGGPLLYLRAEDIAADLPGQLRQAGFTVVEILTYEAVPVGRLPDIAVQGLLTGGIDGVLFYSVRTAEIFLEAAAGAGLMPSLSRVRAVAMGEAAASLLRRSGCKHVSVLRLGDPESAVTGLKALFSSSPATTPKAMPIPPTAEPDDDRPAEPADRLSRRQLRQRLWLIGLVAIIGVAATGQYFYHKRRDVLAFRQEAPAQHRFAELDTHPHPFATLPATTPALEASPPPTLQVSTPVVALPTPPVSRPGPMIPAVRTPADPALMQKLDALQKQLDEQSARLESLEQTVTVQKTENAKLGGERLELVQLVKLRSLIDAGKPFADALSELLSDESLSGELRDKLALLQPVVTDGIATPQTLQTRFAEALKTYETTPPSTEKESVWANMKARVSTLVIVRKVGPDHPGDDDGSVIARAEDATRRGDFDAALKETALLSPHAAPAFADFRTAARDRVKTLAAIDEAERTLTGE